MKLDIETPPPVKVERKFILTLTEKEAIAARTLALAIHNNVASPGPISQFVFELYHVLTGHGFYSSDSEIFEQGNSPVIKAGK